MEQHTELLRFEVLGPMRGWRGAREIDLGAPKQRAVLAVLLLRREQVVTPAELVDAIWGENPPPRAADAMYRYISGLRKALEWRRTARAPAEVLTHVSAGYSIRLPSSQLDLEVFKSRVSEARQLRAVGDLIGALRSFDSSLRLWTGLALGGVTGSFVSGQRAQLIEHRMSVVEERAMVALELGQSEDAVADLTPLVREHPLRERVSELLMRALHQCGRQAEALALFQNTRRMLADELGADPGPNLRLLNLQMLRDDPVLNRPKSLAQVWPAVMAVDATAVSEGDAAVGLPKDQPHLLGRERELSTLFSMHDGHDRPFGGAVVISSRYGAAGVGKTALALHFAHQVADQFPDQRLWVNLRGFDPHQPPLSPSDALACVLQALGDDPRWAINDVDAQSARYRELVDGRRCLILLDNVATSDQVKPLLPVQPGCLVIVTSRNRLSGMVDMDGVGCLFLEPLDPECAIRLLAHAAGADRIVTEPDAAARLALLCGYLPLSLCIIARSLVQLGTMSAAELAKALAYEQASMGRTSPATTAVEAAAACSHSNLPPDLARMFRLLGLHVGSGLSTAAAAALAGVVPTEARRLLDSLSSAHLIRKIGQDRYRLHDEIHRYAAKCARAQESAKDRTNAIRRALAWYLNSGKPVDLVLRPSNHS